jgi:excisionase family DNA binding protein
MKHNNKNESKALMIDYDAKKLAHDTAAHLTPVLYEIVESIQQKKQNEYEKPISMAEACVYLGITRTTFSKIVGKGEVAYSSTNPGNPRAKKLFYRKDLKKWLKSKRSKTLNELKNLSQNG